MLRIRWLARTGIEQFMHLDHPFIKRLIAIFSCIRLQLNNS